MDNPLAALRGSVGRLHQLSRGLDDSALEAQSYCTEWTIADVLSHLGSGAVIMRRQLEDTLRGDTTPGDFAPSVWDVWNAKTPRAKADDALVADQGLLEALEAMSEAERDRFVLSMGPMSLDFEHAVAMRLNEHAMHTWDIEVVFDDGAHLPHDVAAVVVDNLEVIARFAARPTGDVQAIVVRTSDPERFFTLDLAADAVTLAAGAAAAESDIGLPAEAFGRLVYGRLDPAHTPEVTGDSALLGTLRAVFPGF
jgi:uncharacterized protein (TIGR03083 family)